MTAALQEDIPGTSSFDMDVLDTVMHQGIPVRMTQDEEAIIESADGAIDRYDDDKNLVRNTRELYFYPYWGDVERAYEMLKAEKDKIWRIGTPLEEFLCKLRALITKAKKRHIARRIMR